MQVILLEKIHRLGGIGSVVNVKDGFGRNFLIPRKKAIRATKANVELFEKQKEQISKENMEKKAAAELMLESLSNLSVSLFRQAAEDGRLYGSVSSKDIAMVISEKIGKEFSSEFITLNNKFKEIGIYQVTLDLHPEVTTSVQLTIARTSEKA